MKHETLVVIDGNALLHRAWHGVPPLTTTDGTVVNAVYGFANVIERILDEQQPEYLAVAWDLPGKTFRHELYKEYKGTRKKKEPELYAQIPMIQELLDAYKIPNLSVEGMEADDIIGTLAKTYGPDNSIHVRIITGDLDSLQLVADDVEVEFFVKGLSQTKIYDEEAVMDRYGLAPHQLIDLKTLMGDSSDNLPGIPGVGIKTATTLLREHESLVGIIDALNRGELKKSIASKLEDQTEQLKLMRKLVTIVTDVPLDFTVKDAEVEEPDLELLKDLYSNYGFRRWMNKYNDTESTPAPTPKETASMVDWSELEKETLSITIEKKERDLFGSEIGVIWLSDGKNISKVENPEESQIAAIVEALSNAKELVCYDYKGLLHEFSKLSVKQTGVNDLLLLDYLVESHARDNSLETILTKYAGLKEGDDGGQVVRLMSKAAESLNTTLKERNMTAVYEDIDFPLLAVLYQMESAGIAVDKVHLEDMSKTFEGRISSLTKDIHRLADKEFNINSPSQLSEILFEDLNLPTKGIKKTKTAYSTAASELEKLWDEHEIIPKISEYREIAKLQSTYVEALPKLVAADGRIHTTYNPAVAATGRLSSTDPNLQNIPTRTELGREIRKAFVADSGKILVAMDYSQIELRLAAAFAEDSGFIDAFQADKDIHAVTAAQVLGKEESEVTKAERSAAKAINFGILYGMGVRNLAKSTGFSQEDAKSFMAKYFDLHKGINEYMDRMKEFAHNNGYVETEDGRRRYLPEINSHVPMLRAAAERMAINMPIQGTQADLLKRAMISIEAWIKKASADITMLLQVHDELIFEVAESDVEKIIEPIKEIMTTAWKGKVPLKVNVETGKNWGELKPYDIK